MQSPSLSQDLPACLRPSASAIVGCEPLAADLGRAGLLVLHGFTGSPWEVRPLAEAARSLGFSVALPVLAGHATHVDDLADKRWPDWLASALEAHVWLQARCDRVHIAGLSMGALLALQIARSGRQPPPRSLLLLAPAMTLAPEVDAFVRAASRLGWPRRVGKGDPRLPGGLRPPAYGAIPLRAARSLLALMDEVLADRTALAMPALSLHGEADATIPCERAQRLLAPLLGPQGLKVRVPDAGHLLLRTAQGEAVLRRCVLALQTLEPYGPDAPGKSPRRV